MNPNERQFIEDQNAEAIHEYILKAASELFDAYPELENFSWVQGYDSNGEFIADVEDFTINDSTFWGGGTGWKVDVNSQLKLVFELLDDGDLLNLFGDNSKVVVHREGIDTLDLC